MMWMKDGFEYFSGGHWSFCEMLVDKEFDLILWGVTGQTGGNTLLYVQENYPDLNFAIAGRNSKKLESIVSSSTVKPPIIIADSSDKPSLASMCKRGRVLISTVGPFEIYGKPLVEACVENGCHYVDSTGESGFIYDIIKKYHQKAKENGVLIIPSCGFDSVPSDLSAFL